MRQTIQQFFARGLNIVQSRARLKNGQSYLAENVEFDVDTVRRRKGRSAAYQYPVGDATDLFAPSLLKRFYHHATDGLTRKFMMAAGIKFWVYDSDWSDPNDGAPGTVITAATEIVVPTVGNQSLYLGYEAGPIVVDESSMHDSFHSREWAYVQVDYTDSDDTDSGRSVPLRTDAGVAYGNNLFLHGLTPPLSLLSSDTEHMQIPANTEWDEEEVEASAGISIGGQCCVMDADGYTHMVFIDTTANSLQYSSRAPSSGVWSSMVAVDGAPSTVINQANYGGVSIAVDLDGYAHVVWNDPTTGGGVLHYATNRASGTPYTGAFVLETAISKTGDATHQIGLYNSIVIDRDNNPHIIFYSGGTQDNLYETIHNDVSGWSAESAIDSTGDVGTNCTAQIDSAGLIHVAYMDSSNNAIKYAVTDSAGAWTTSTIDTTGVIAPPLFLALDDDDLPGVVYTVTGTGVVYRKYDGSSWSARVTVSGTDNQDVALAIDSTGIAHVAISESTVAFLYGNNNGVSGAWSTANFTVTAAASLTARVAGIVVSNNFVGIGLPVEADASSASPTKRLYALERSSYYYKLTAEYDDLKLGESGPSSATLISYKGDVRPAQPRTLTISTGVTRYDMTKEVTRINIYRTVKGDVETGLYYRVGFVEITAGDGVVPLDFEDNVSDSDLVNALLHPILNPDRFMPPKYNTGVIWRNRGWIGNLKARDTSAEDGSELDTEAGGYHPNRIRYSEANHPDVFPANYFLEADVGGESGTVQKLIVARSLDSLLCFLEDDTVLIVGEGPSGTPFRAINLPRGDGTPAPGSVVEDGEGNIWAWTKTGIQVYRGGEVEDVTQDTIKTLWNQKDTGHPSYDDRINMDQLSLVQGVYVPGEEKILWTYPSGAFAINTAVLVLDLDQTKRVREPVFSISKSWFVSRWAVWQGEDDKQEVFGGDAGGTVNRAWVYRYLLGNEDASGNSSGVVSEAAISSKLSLGHASFKRPDMMRLFRNLVVEAASGNANTGTSFAISMNMDDAATDTSLGAWVFDASMEIKRLSSGIPRSQVGRRASLKLVMTDTLHTDDVGPPPWELHSISWEVEDLPGRHRE